MLEKSRGIVLQNFRYGDTSLVSHIFTEKLGRKSFLFKGIRSKKSKNKANQLQPLMLINLDFYYKEHKDLLLVKEFDSSNVFADFPYHPLKSTQAMLMAEILDKCLIEEVKNDELFHFLENAIHYFDLKENDSSNFHLAFLMKLTKYLGILPKKGGDGKYDYFDLLEGKFSGNKPIHKNYADETISPLLYRVYEEGFEESSGIKISAGTRNILLKIILRYYTIHNYNLEKLKSISVLFELFRE